MSDETLKVVFRTFKKSGEVIALFPELPWRHDTDWFITSYMHIGQHGEAARDIVQVTRLSTPEEYAPLLKEYESLLAFVADYEKVNAPQLVISKKLNRA